MSFINRIKKPLLVAVCCSFTAGAMAGTQVASETFHLKTSFKDVNGVREIEQGNYVEGIARTKAALARTTVGVSRLPLLNNLCVAYVAMGDLESAKAPCDEAVEVSNNDVFALNNRAVMHCLADNTPACIADLTQANDRKTKQRIVAQNLELAKSRDLLTKN
ncbi:hypothetical protein [Alteromonas lipolytica]|uniref:Tetratricopeptide repeat protein n=1 Tax=Alteromonas lipolytica TaxID=1856405 RepID=A0A1E8FFY8_9ALTE|nr:hypothetical protein [Alteromonas lipolytica]OFI34841.1 hypothetical protein BFC17_14800 [Alteromonas lipolytica]GGF54415.1 hypothetical protein GCM10011338_03270 [Alteromonas lipolytica]